MSALLLLSGLLPLLLAWPAVHRRGAAAMLAAPLPALLAGGWSAPGAELALPWLLLGTTWGLDETTRVFLLGSALVWLAAALYARGDLATDPQAGRFRVFFLLAMAGNFQLILAQDLLGFYLGFAQMGLAAYGLVAHRRSTLARRAARTYLGWTVVGELLLFAALTLVALAAPDLRFATLREANLPDAALLLLVLGFGIKLALPGLHLWLPLAYPAAPPAGAAVLGGAMINAGVLGWLQFLPLGSAGHTAWGGILVAIGLCAAFYGVLVGLPQRRAKTVLAYSSMSQMGLLTAAFGVALADPAQAPVLTGVIVLYAVHHGLAKGALFLALDALGRPGAATWRRLLLVVPAAALAGAPFTSGLVAKVALKDALPVDWAWIGALLAASTLATTLLMGRLLNLAWHRTGSRQAAPGGALAAVALPVAAGLLLAYLPGSAVPAGVALAAAWPIALGAAVTAAVWMRPPAALARAVGAVPPGDIPAMVWRTLRRCLRAGREAQLRPHSSHTRLNAGEWPNPLPGLEARLRAWPVAGLFWLALLLVLVATALRQTGG